MDSVVEGYVGMRKVTVNTKELLQKIKANREKHVQEYNEAVVGYKEALEQRGKEVADNFLSKIAKATLPEAEPVPVYADSVNLVVPVSHQEDYDQVIEMLEMSLNAGTEKQDIQTDEFACYVRDNWKWKYKKAALAFN